MSKVIDYDALARQSNGTPDYDSIASEHGGTTDSTPSPTLLQSRQQASTQELNQNLPESTLTSRAREAAIGLLEPFDLHNVPSAVSSLADAFKDVLTGKGTAKAQQAVKGLIMAPVNPVVNMEEGIRTGDYDRASYAAGGFASQTAPAILGAANVGNAALSAAANSSAPETLMRASNAMENAAAARPANVPLTTAGAVREALAPALRAGGTASAKLAAWLAQRQTAPTFPEAAPIVEDPAAMAEAGAQSLEEQRAANQAIYEQQIRAKSEAYQQPGPPATPVAIPKPSSPLTENFLNRLRSDAAIENYPTGEIKVPVTRGPDLDFSVEELEAGALARPDVATIEKAIAPSGNKAKLSTIRNAPKLADLAPELAGVQAGPKFDSALMDAFKRTTQGVNDAEDAIPKGTTVPQDPIINGLGALYQEYMDRGLTSAANSVAKEWEKWSNLPSDIPWDAFRDMKRSFFEGNNINSAAMRRAYGVLMNASSEVSPELAQANSQYSTVRQALQNANIDLKTGRRIANVGKTPKTTFLQRSTPPQ